MKTSEDARRRPVLLGGYAAKQCPRRVHNDWDSTIPKVAWEPTTELQARFDAGIAFEVDVFAVLRSRLGPRCVDLSGIELKVKRISATLAAMGDRVEVILGGQLPDDPAAGRTGKPDLLLCVSGDSKTPAYIPGDVKAHRTTKGVVSKTLSFSTPADPTRMRSTSGYAEIVSDRFDDFVQLAHYTRMLEGCGYGPATGPRWGVILGTDDLAELDPAGRVLVWHDLTDPVFQTFSRSNGKVKRSALERYDHEHGFRLRVARTAQHRTGSADDPKPLVAPIFQKECDSCPWHDYCLSELGEGVASVEITDGRLDVREWRALSALGVHTTTELANLVITDQAWLTKYRHEVTHQPRASERLGVAVQRAQMIRDGIELRRTTEGPLDIPTADVEIDLDIEWDTDDRVYLWGAQIRGTEGDDYRALCSFEPMTADSQRLLAQVFLDRLRRQITEATSQGRTLAVFHYSSPEPAYLKKILGEGEVTDVLPFFVDLLPLMRDNFLGAHGLSIKKVAPVFGFAWRDEDPGGLQSQLWLAEARSADDPDVAQQLRSRIVLYNQDDVRATAALRDGLRNSQLSR